MDVTRNSSGILVCRKIPFQMECICESIEIPAAHNLSKGFSMYKLHYFPGNASFTPHVLLRELGVPFELKLVDRSKNAHKDSDYLKINPAGRIPTLEDDDLVLFETAAICLHLCDTHMDANLAPLPATSERALFYQWLIFLTNTIQPDVLMFYYNERYTTDPDGGPAVKEAADQRLVEWFQLIEDRLGEGPYFMGDKYSVLDIYLLMLARWGRFLQKPPRDMPKINALAKRVLERPAVKQTIAEEGIKGDFLI